MQIGDDVPDANTIWDFKELLEKGNIKDTIEFSDKHLYSNISLRALLKSTLDRFFIEKRLGKNLKGMNRGILQ